MPYVLARRFAPLLVCLALAAPAAAQHTRVTAALGGAQPNGMNGAGVLSADGHFVAFESDAIEPGRRRHQQLDRRLRA